MANYFGKNDILTDVVLYLRTVLVAESLSERAEKQRQQLLKKLSKRELSPARGPYMDMNARSKGLITRSSSIACLHQQAAYEEMCASHRIYNNVPYEDEDDDEYGLSYEPFPATNGYSPTRRANGNKRLDNNYSSMGSLNKTGSSSLSSRSNGSDSSDGSNHNNNKCDVIYVSANAVKYSASKYGALTKREKILFVDHTKKYWAAVLSSTMYVYNGDKDTKPCLIIHLEGYAARDAGGSRNKEWLFEIVCPGKKTYQFIAQNQKDMHSWIDAINNSGSKPPSPEIMLSPSPICFKQEMLPNRELPVPPTADATVYYDKPNPIIRPVNLYENATDEVDMESIYHFIDESKHEKVVLPKIDKQFCNGDTSYYNTPSNIPVTAPVKGDHNNNNEYGDYFTEKETNCDVVITNNEREVTEEDDQVLGVQQIIQKIEEINSKKTSPRLRRKLQTPKNNSLMRNSTPVYTTDEFYEPMKVISNIPKTVVVSSQSFRNSR